MKYLDRLGANGELKLCENGCMEMIKVSNQKDLLHNQAAALKIYSKYFEKKTMPLLLKLADNSDSSFRMAVLNIASKIGDPAYTKKWIGKAKKANPDYKADVIYMLGERDDKSAVPFVRECLNDKSEKVRISSVWALVKLDKQKALTDLLDHLSNGIDVIESEKALSTLLDENQLDKVVNALNSATDEGKTGLINLIAAKSGKRYFKEVFSFALSNNNSIRTSAVLALKNVSGYDDLTDLFQLLPKLKNEKDIENLQAAIVNSLMEAKNAIEAETKVLNELEKSSQKELILPVIPYVGGKKALDAVVKLFNESEGTLKKASLMSLVNWKGY